MKITLELFGASRDFSNKDYLEFNIKDHFEVKDLRKIIVDNSGNEKLKKSIEEQYDNCECYLMDENLGYGGANNFGINKSKTDYVFIINPDTNINEEKYKK